MPLGSFGQKQLNSWICFNRADKFPLASLQFQYFLVILAYVTETNVPNAINVLQACIYKSVKQAHF